MRRRAPFVVLAFVATLFAACSQILGDVGNEPIDGGDASAMNPRASETGALDASTQDVSLDQAMDGTLDARGATDVDVGGDAPADREGNDASSTLDVGAYDAGCSAGASRCDGTGGLQQVCQGDGGWLDRPCSAFCAGGACRVPPSCSKGELASACGSSGTQGCCAARTVPGGTFHRSYDGVTDNGTQYGQDYPATVSGFNLDAFEVTVGRFRNFVAGYDDWGKPSAGDGRNANDAMDRGWEQTWTAQLQTSASALKAQLACTQNGRYGTWTDSPGPHESLPITCVDWFTAFAFCIWDGGRLATEAEWNFAAAGGAEQRVYPWSPARGDQTIVDSDAVYLTDAAFPVGAKPAGRGRWGHSDLAGNAEEWVRDWYADPYTSPQCTDCANLAVGDFVVLRGGSFAYTSDEISTSSRDYTVPGPSGALPTSGVRCARTVLVTSFANDE